jgi:hypothetical protein
MRRLPDLASLTGDLYHLPLEIGIQTARGTRFERVRLDDRSAEYRLAVDAEPTGVTLDPRRWLLAKVVAK